MKNIEDMIMALPKYIEQEDEIIIEFEEILKNEARPIF